MNPADTATWSRSNRVISTTILIIVCLLAIAAGSGIASANTTAESNVTVSVDADQTVAPGENTTITLSSNQVSEWSVEGNVGGWTVVETDPSSLSTFPDASIRPYTSEDDSDTWGHVYGSPQSDASWTLTLRAPSEPGDYNLTGVAEYEAGDAQNTATISVKEPTSTVTIESFENQTGLENKSTDIGVSLTNDGTATANQTVSLAIAGETVDQQQVTLQPNTTTDVVFESVSLESLPVGDHEIQLTSENKTATATLTVRKAHESGVAEETYNAANQDDSDNLTRGEIRDVVRAYVINGEINRVGLNRDDVRLLVQYYVTTGSR